MIDEREKKVYNLIDLVTQVAKLETNLAAARAELKRANGEVEDLVQAAADRHLVDGNGQPVDGGIYWFSHTAIVRVGTIVQLIPIKTMDGSEVFATPSLELPIEEMAEAA